MNELEKTLQKVLEKSMEVAEQTGEFIIDQSPEILEQFFMWHLVSHIFGFIISLILPIGFVWLFKFGFSEKAEENDTQVISWMLGGIGAIVTFLFLCDNLNQIIFISIAPKIYLIEYFIR
ncbi:MAG: hypothetical protein JKY53_15110 [Flavobacteriales bacterium]|nr:hypothetical protein [Flavobacteriales bacterium]